MELGLDLFESLGAPLAPSGRAPEWAGLRARLAAAYEARRELAFDLAGTGLPGGGFNRFARMRAASREFAFINPVVSADGKEPCGNDVATAGEDVAGGRGTR